MNINNAKGKNFSNQHRENTSNSYSPCFDFTHFSLHSVYKLLLLLLCCHLNLIWLAFFLSFFLSCFSPNLIHLQGSRKAYVSTESLHFYWIIHKQDHTNYNLNKYHIMQSLHSKLQWITRSSLRKAGKTAIILHAAAIDIIHNSTSFNYVIFNKYKNVLIMFLNLLTDYPYLCYTAYKKKKNAECKQLSILK